MKAELEVRLELADDGSTRASGVLAAPPMWCRWDGSTLWMVGSAASPVGEDHVCVRVHVGEGVRASVRTVAAMIVYAATGEGTRLHTELSVASGATLRWLPDPVIVTGRARHRSMTDVSVDRGGALQLDEIVVLGRLGEAAGASCNTLQLSIAGEPALLTSFETASPAWSGPGGAGGALVSATRLVVADDDRTECPEDTTTVGSTVLRPEGGGALAIALADDPGVARRVLDERLRLLDREVVANR